MTSKIKVDNIADQDDNNIINESGDVITVGAAGDTVVAAGNIVKSNAYQASDGGSIISQSGTTITIGASGDTVSLASGASQSGFGRSGSVNWQTGSIKTGNFTAANGEGYFINTTSGAIVMNLPAGSAGDIVALADYAGTFDSNKVTITPNGTDKIGGSNASSEITTKGLAVTLVFVDSTQGWIDVGDNTQDITGQQFITATGGTITTVDTNFKVHTFTGPGTFCVSAGAGPLAVADYMVVAGGGGTGPFGGGGGGAGGFRESHSEPVSGPFSNSPLATSTSLPISPGPFSITVGGGGASGSNGSNSTFSTITSAGGGKSARSTSGSDGGSGGGGGQDAGGGAGSGNTPPVSPPQGQNGGPGASGPFGAGGGGGGATQVGAAGQGPGNPSSGGNGGNGATTSITGSPVTRAGGGGGGGNTAHNPASGGSGGSGGGGAGGGPDGAGGNAGTANTGGGAGAGEHCGAGAAGGSGIVVIRYKFQ